MLKSLALQDFAIIDSVKIDFGPGLNVFSGETGAGKSIIIEALSFVLGARGDSGMVRHGAAKMSVTAVFSAAALPAGIKKIYSITGEDFVLKRELDSKGKGRAWVAGLTVPAGKLAEIGEFLADFHGQHEHQTLIKPAVQRELLDRYANSAKELKVMAERYGAFKQADSALNAAKMSKEERERMLDVYKFQAEEIEKAALKEGEDLELEQQLPKLKHAGKLKEFAAEAYEALYEGETNAVSLGSRALRNLEEMARLDGALSSLSEDMRGALDTLSAAGEAVADYLGGIDADGSVLDAMLARQQLISRLKTKYGPEITDVLQKAQTLEREINALENAEENQKELAAALERARAAMVSAAEELHDKRFNHASRLADAVTKEIKPLGFNEIRFAIDCEFDEFNIGPEGGDRVEFVFSPNPGSALKPLKNIASGGEMSRVMLGLRAVLSAQGGVPVIIFDEIDAGIGGGVGLLVGEKLHKVAQGKTVLCVTHLAQVAAYADRNFSVEKTAAGRSTAVKVNLLEGEKKTLEIARMLSGATDINSAGYKHAVELLEKTENM